MKYLFLFFFVVLVANSLGAALPDEKDQRAIITIVSREEWGAKPPIGYTPMSNPVQYVVVHSSHGSPCSTDESCATEMRNTQTKHMSDNITVDINYSFCVGGNGLAYEARGWNREAGDFTGVNNRSIAICTIGTYKTTLPPPNQLLALRELIFYGVTTGRISSNYRLVAHRQIESTDCPGDALYTEISTWPNFQASPTYEDIQEGWKEVSADKII